MFVVIKAPYAVFIYLFIWLNFVWIISVLISEDHGGSISSWLNCKDCMSRTQTRVCGGQGPLRSTLFPEAHYHKHTTQIKVSQCVRIRRPDIFHKYILYSTSHSFSSPFALCVYLNVKPFFKDHCVPLMKRRSAPNHTLVSY